MCSSRLRSATRSSASCCAGGACIASSDEWRTSLEDALSHPRTRRSGEAKRIKELEREVAYKDKALAETAALLVLQKKLRLLFPVDEDNDTGESNDK